VSLGEGDGLTLGLLGYCLLNQENYLSAQVAYQQAVLVDPGNLDWRLGLIKCFIALGTHAPAINLLDELIAQYPDREQLWSLQANVFVQLEQPQKAIVNLEAIRRLNKANLQNLGLLGDLYMAQDAKDLALPIYLEAMEKEKGQNPARAFRATEILASRGAWDEANTMMAKIREIYGVGLSPEDELRSLRLEARIAMGREEGRKAITLLEQITERNPTDGEALLLAGDYYARNGEPERAEIRYESAAKVEGYSADAWVKHAQLLVQQRKYPEAVELLRRAQKLQPRDNIQDFLERVQVAAQRAGRS
jgi:tetratricopeptide (TPR) repeat protein